MNIELVCIQMVKKRLDAKWSYIQMRFKYLTAQPFEHRTNEYHLVFLCTDPVFKWLV